MPGNAPPRPPHLLVLVGIPGAGKTTYARRLCARCPAVRLISPDEFRERLYPGYQAGRSDIYRMDNDRIFRLAYRAVTEALAAGKDVVFDATSLTVSRRQKLIQLGQRYAAVLIARYFPIHPREALHRNRLRPRQVPPAVILHMAAMLQPPERAEGFARVVRHRARGGKV